ncbi:MAG: nitrogen fixation protein NifM [Sedimenticolaceae bacterium]
MSTERQAEHDPAFNYHMLRNALDSHSRNLAQLNADQYRQVLHKSSKSYHLESLVLASPEADGLVVPGDQLEVALREVAKRYANEDEFVGDLRANGLDPDSLRRALRRELMFDAIMQRVAARAATVNDIDARLFYEMHSDRFESPELRTARHILVTVNNDYLENTRPAALSRIEQVKEKLRGRANRFADLARRHSECPTAMEGGILGEVRRGALYPELDAALFALQEGELSPIVESEIGFHILLCEKIKPGKRTAYAKAAPKILEILTARRQRNCQKTWLADLQRCSG